jgi:hypothetical protein
MDYFYMYRGRKFPTISDCAEVWAEDVDLVGYWDVGTEKSAATDASDKHWQAEESAKGVRVPIRHDDDGDYCAMPVSRDVWQIACRLATQLRIRNLRKKDRGFVRVVPLPVYDASNEKRPYSAPRLTKLEQTDPRIDSFQTKENK